MPRSSKPAGVPDTVVADPLLDVSPSDPPPAFPRAVRITSLYGYYADDGVLRMWCAGEEVTDPDEIAELQLQCAPIVEI